MNNLEIDILKPSIFPKHKVIAGVTKRNFERFPPKGFTISPATDPVAIQHRMLLSKFLKVDLGRLKFQKQIHSDIIKIVNNDTSNDSESDAMITDVKGLVLNVSLADCTGILIFDPVKEIIGAVHSGWRGTKLNIVSKTIDVIINKFNTNPNNLLIYLSPSASGKNYEVGWDVAQFFPKHIKNIGNGKYLFDNIAQIKEQLINKGVLESNIEISNICTIENVEYHSFRRDKENSGRMSAFIGMI